MKLLYGDSAASTLTDSRDLSYGINSPLNSCLFKSLFGVEPRFSSIDSFVKDNCPYPNDRNGRGTILGIFKEHSTASKTKDGKEDPHVPFSVSVSVCGGL